MAAARPNPVDAPVMSTDFDRAGIALEARTTALQHLAAVHLPQRIGDQFDTSSVRVPKIQRDTAVLGELHTGGGELVPQPLPARRLHADCDVVQPTENLLV